MRPSAMSAGPLATPGRCRVGPRSRPSRPGGAVAGSWVSEWGRSGAGRCGRAPWYVVVIAGATRSGAVSALTAAAAFAAIAPVRARQPVLPEEHLLGVGSLGAEQGAHRLASVDALDGLADERRH